MGSEDEVRTTCPYCGVGCGIVATLKEGRVGVRGDPDHPANYGRLCSKGSALAETLGLEGRLLHPEVNGKRVSWEAALDHVAHGMRKAVGEHGSDAVAFYLSGQLLTEDYYVANKLMKGFIGSANVDTNSRLCMSSAVTAYQRAFGADVVPCNYEDLEQADLVVLVGSNTAWCHPVLYQRIAAARKARPGMRVIVIDPRRTETTDLADLHLALEPGSDAVLFNGLLVWLVDHGFINEPFVNRHTRGTQAATDTARASSPSIEVVAKRCGLQQDDVRFFFEAFAESERVVSAYSQGINQSASGTDKNNAVINCHLLTGRIGKPGMGPFSLTGQPNAMGGREVGGLATQLACHRGFDKESVDSVSRFWNASSMASGPGVKATELVDAIEAGRIRVLWIMATNPVVSLPDADRVRSAFKKLELLVVSDCVDATDTLDLAHVRLPSLAWGEKEGTVTNSERRISRQRAFLPPPGDARADWWQVCEVARGLGFGRNFDYSKVADIFREHAALSALNRCTRAFDVGAFAALDDAGYEGLEPTQWPLQSRSLEGSPRLFSDGRFFTRDNRAKLIPVEPKAPPEEVEEKFPLRLNSGRIRDHWHTLTRTGHSARLSRHTDEPCAQIHPNDAKRADLKTDDITRVVSRRGEILLRIKVDSRQRPGTLFVPMHWSDQFAATARVGSLIASHSDPYSGQPESKTTPVRLERFVPRWHGFVASRRPFSPDGVAYWAKARGTSNWRYRIAGHGAPAALPELWPDLCDPHRAEWLEYADPATGTYRAICLLAGRLEVCLYAGAKPPQPDVAWLETIFDQSEVDSEQRLTLLAGYPKIGGCPSGRIVCACGGVGEDAITEAVIQNGVNSLEALGAALGAGIQCGSCIPELKGLMAKAARQKVA